MGAHDLGGRAPVSRFLDHGSCTGDRVLMTAQTHRHPQPVRFALLLLGVLLLFTPAVLKAQDRNIRFEQLSLEDGLSQSVVNSVYQDSRGFIWIGTQDGLNRYDGYKFKVYEYDPDNETSLSENYIFS